MILRTVTGDIDRLLIMVSAPAPRLTFALSRDSQMTPELRVIRHSPHGRLFKPNLRLFGVSGKPGITVMRPQIPSSSRPRRPAAVKPLRGCYGL